MPNLDPEKFPPRPDGPAAGGATMGDLVRRPFEHPGGPCSSSDCTAHYATERAWSETVYPAPHCFACTAVVWRYGYGAYLTREGALAAKAADDAGVPEP